MEKKTLAVFTGTRAEYGLLRPVIFKLLKSDKIIPKVVVTGAHLAPEFGNTVQEIEAEDQARWQQMSLEEHMEHYESQGNSRKEAMKLVAKDRGVSKRDVYQALLEAEEA